MTADAAHGACVVATQAYTLKTLTVRDDAFIVVQAGAKVLHAPDTALAVGPGQGVMLARGTQWDVTNDPRGRREYSALVLGFPDAILRDFQALEGAAAVPAVTAAQAMGVDEELLAAGGTYARYYRMQFAQGA